MSYLTEDQKLFLIRKIEQAFDRMEKEAHEFYEGFKNSITTSSSSTNSNSAQHLHIRSDDKTQPPSCP